MSLNRNSERIPRRLLQGNLQFFNCFGFYIWCLKMPMQVVSVG